MDGVAPEPTERKPKTMSKPFTIKITLPDIRKAKRNDWEQCPLSRAIRRTYPGNSVSVFDEQITVNGVIYSHTEDSKSFVDAWNEGPVRCCTIHTPDFREDLK